MAHAMSGGITQGPEPQCLAGFCVKSAGYSEQRHYYSLQSRLIPPEINLRSHRLNSTKSYIRVGFLLTHNRFTPSAPSLILELQCSAAFVAI